MNSEYNEKELIQRSQQGDRQAFGLLYDRYVRVIYNFIFYKTFHKESAEDLTSQTFFKALRTIDRVDPSRPFQSWLFKIAHNSVIDHYRSHKEHRDVDDFWDLSDEDVDVVGDIDKADQIKRIKEHLKELNTTEREIVMLRVWQELSYKEIAEIVGKTESNCKVIYSRALEKLRKTMPVALLLLLLLKST